VNAQLLIPAAGMGTRLGWGGPKALVPLEGKPLLAHTLTRFEDAGLIESAVILVPPGSEKTFRDALIETFPNITFKIVSGGNERQDSVRLGLDALAKDTEVVLIHDAARPFVSIEAIRSSIDAAQDVGAATVAIPTIDTILHSEDGESLGDTPPRETMWACQTPQTFRLEVIRHAHAQAKENGYAGTDDATLVRQAGHPVKLVMGTPTNIKITTPSDFAFAETILREELA
jgi:2-C-methyl-D-erythritol 4-phosphate cytidylyltransferase